MTPYTPLRNLMAYVNEMAWERLQTEAPNLAKALQADIVDGASLDEVLKFSYTNIKLDLVDDFRRAAIYLAEMEKLQ